MCDDIISMKLIENKTRKIEEEYVNKKGKTKTRKIKEHYTVTNPVMFVNLFGLEKELFRDIENRNSFVVELAFRNLNDTLTTIKV